MVHEGVLWIYGGGVPARRDAVGLALALGAGGWTEQSVETSTDGPARSGHVAVVIGTRMVVHGGRDADGAVCSDVHTFDLGGSRSRRGQRLTALTSVA